MIAIDAEIKLEVGRLWKIRKSSQSKENLF